MSNEEGRLVHADHKRRSGRTVGGTRLAFLAATPPNEYAADLCKTLDSSCHRIKMRARTIPSIALLLSLCVAASCNSAGKAPRKAAGDGDASFGTAEWKWSAIPLRPGEPGKSPFWNAYA